MEVGAIATISAAILPGGEDIYRYYLPFAGGCMQCGFVPYYAHWILYPLSLLPTHLVWPVMTAISALGFILLCKFTGANPALLMLSFPAMGQFWLGQIDVIVAAGLVIGVLATNPYLRGVGILLSLVKPQLSLLAVLTLLIDTPRSELLKTLSIPLIAVMASILIYGFSWPLDWINNAAEGLPVHMWRLASMDIWKFGIVSIVLIILLGRLRFRPEAALLLMAIATPFFSVYSYVIFFVFRTTWWMLLLSYAWILAYPALGQSSMRLAWVLPVSLLGYLIYTGNLTKTGRVDTGSSRSRDEIGLRHEDNTEP